MAVAQTINCCYGGYWFSRLEGNELGMGRDLVIVEKTSWEETV